MLFNSTVYQIGGGEVKETYFTVSGGKTVTVPYEGKFAALVCDNYGSFHETHHAISVGAVIATEDGFPYDMLGGYHLGFWMPEEGKITVQSTNSSSVKLHVSIFSVV